VEFALVLTPLTLLLLAIIQLGLVFNAYVTISNAVREGARSGSIYVYDRSKTKSWNDTARAAVARDVMVSGMGMLKATAPQLSASAPTITYSVPSGVADSDTRSGQELTVQLHYNMDLILPLVADLLPLQNGRLPMDATITVVVN
jgi:Flp pilus assembly protein TadG